jgi:hypothetical protein
MSDEVVEKAINLSEKFIGKTNQQFSPVVIMLAALFIAARMNGTPITQQRLAKYGAHELSIRNCAKKILEVLGIPREQIRRELAYDAGKNQALERLESRINDLDISKESKDSVLKEIKEVKKSFHSPQSEVKEVVP